MTSEAITTNPAKRSSLQLAWALGRLPLLALIVLLLRGPLLDLIERTVDIVGVTLFVIDRFSTPLTRVLLTLGAAAGYFVIAKGGERIGGLRGYAIALAAAAIVTALATKVLGGQLRIAILIAALLAFNWAPLSALARVGLNAKTLDRLIAIPPGLGEAVFSGRYVSWVSALLRGAPSTHAEQPLKWPSALIAALVLALLIPGTKLVPAEQAMRSGPDVRTFAHGDFNGLAYDPAGGRIFATGHGAEKLLSYNAANLDENPIEAAVATDYAQGLDFNPAAKEVYVFAAESHAILVLDAATLAVKQTIPAPDVSPGDSWVAYEAKTNTITVSSEADQQSGIPLLVFDRSSGAVLDKSGEEAGNVLIDPNAPIVYLSYFRRKSGVLAFDLEKLKVVADAPTDARMDRMAFDAKHNEVLIASPAEGRVQRFEAKTLAPKGVFGAIYGVRVLAIDAERDMMMVGSLATGKIALMGLSDRKVKRTWYLGPWLRSIVIAPDRGVAYVSSQEALYELRFATGD